MRRPAPHEKFVKRRSEFEALPLNVLPDDSAMSDRRTRPTARYIETWELHRDARTSVSRTPHCFVVIASANANTCDHRAGYAYQSRLPCLYRVCKTPRIWEPLRIRIHARDPQQSFVRENSVRTGKPRTTPRMLNGETLFPKRTREATAPTWGGAPNSQERTHSRKASRMNTYASPNPAVLVAFQRHMVNGTATDALRRPGPIP